MPLSRVLSGRRKAAVLACLLGACLGRGGLVHGGPPFWLDPPSRDNPHDPKSPNFCAGCVLPPTRTPQATPVAPTATCSPTQPGPTPTSSPSPPIFQTPTATPTPSPAATPCFAWDFEGGSQSWQAATGGNGGITSAAAGTAMAHDGTGSLVLTADYVAGVTSYGQVFNSGAPLPADLSGKVITAWLYVPGGMSQAGMPNQAYFNVQATGSYTWHQSSPMDLPSTGGWVQLSYDMGTIPAADAADVRVLGIWVILGAGAPSWSGTLYLDSLDLGFGCLAPASATPTASFSPTPALGCTGWDFEDGAQSWQAATGGNGGISSVAPRATQVHDGAGSLELSANFVAGATSYGQVFNTAAPLPADLSGRIISAWLYVPAGMSQAGTPNQAYMNVQSTASYNWHQSAPADLPPAGGWVQLSYDMSGIPSADAADVRVLGIWVILGSGAPSWSGLLYLDTVCF